MKNWQKKSGFTLIELLVVSTIIAVLAGIAMVSFSAASKTARDGKRKADMETVRQALTLYKQQNALYPNTNYDGVVGTSYLTNPSSTYLSPPTPIDPGGSGSVPYTYGLYGSSFCVCAKLENPKGNSNGSCATLTLTTGTHYCATGL